MSDTRPAVTPATLDRMREDWNARATEDASYYVAFGRRDQDDEEFFETGREIVAGLEWELRRVPPGPHRQALEIGCGPGRLMRPMARHFAEIHGVDVSDQMIERARRNLAETPNAFPRLGDGARLSAYAPGQFDFAYSYAVFQHIPSKEVVYEYLRELNRVLKVGAVARLQFSGLPEDTFANTWSGVRFTAQELREFTRQRGFQVLTLEGEGTQYQWTTWRKREPAWRLSLPDLAAISTARIRRVTNANRAEPVAPSRGRFASISLWVEGLPDEVDLFDLDVRIGGVRARPTYIGPADEQGLQQVNVLMPELDRTGLVPAELYWFEQRLSHAASLRVIPPGPAVPRLLALSDGVNLLSERRVESGTLKATFEELERPEEFSATLNGIPVVGLEVFCTDPWTERYELNFRVPDGVRSGRATLEMRVGRRQFPPVELEIA
jgi:cyclopropane fatty-acyl-phospholipid synthase-like methyltransferase